LQKLRGNGTWNAFFSNVKIYGFQHVGLKGNGSGKRSGRDAAAFTFPEVLCAAMLIGVAMATIFLSLGQGYTFTQENSCNIRATQILNQQLETIRLYTWDQITNGSYIATAFTNYYYPNGDSNGNVGITFTGTLNIANASLTENYSNYLRQVTVTINWNPGSNWTTGFQHQLQGSTFVCQYGMQNYIYPIK
jgi:Tfp pilus assembly protein PilV